MSQYVEKTAPGRREEERARRRSGAWLWAAAAAVLLLLPSGEAGAQTLLERLPVPSAEQMPLLAPTREAFRFTFSFRGHDRHPDLLYTPYMAGPLLVDSASAGTRTIRAFRDLLIRYEQRMGADDNFTIRVVDDRTGELLERYVLEAERARYEAEGEANWGRIDAQRRQEMRRLVDKYVRQGVPRRDVGVKWGRADQVLQARRAEQPTIEYEVQLARMLGLSLLATEIGTVETFNQDRLVSSSGARSRYQMMPFLLRQYGLGRYTLQTASGGSASVVEEWHPLLTMEPAFATLKGYANAVGHEIPGLSAYHAGPGNVFRIYRKYMAAHTPEQIAASSVVDAFMWALTEGYEEVSRGSSFGSYSRGYVPSAYGALRATEHLPVDTAQTLRTERVRLKPGREVLLSELLLALGEAERLSWGAAGEAALYRRFRDMNPHIVLPEGRGAAVPVRGDLRLVSSVGRHPVRFFLPLGSTEALAEAGLDLLDEEATFRFERDTYSDPMQGEETRWDRAYRDLVEEIARFGFTRAHRERLVRLREQFEKLAREDPSTYRRLQLDVIRGHERLWRSAPWNRLAAARQQALGAEISAAGRTAAE